MQPLRTRESDTPASGVLHGLRAGVLAVLCVLLPLTGHMLTQGHAPRWITVTVTAAVAVPGAVVLTRRRLSDAQLLGVLVAAQLAHHAAYSLPGTCAAVRSCEGSSGLSRLVEHDAAAGQPPAVALAGHLVTLLLAARLLGITERMLWQSRSLFGAVHRLLLFLWPLLSGRHAGYPGAVFPQSTAPLMSALLVRLHEGRAPPRCGRGSQALHRSTPIGGLCLS